MVVVGILDTHLPVASYRSEARRPSVIRILGKGPDNLKNKNQKGKKKLAGKYLCIKIVVFILYVGKTLHVTFYRMFYYHFMLMRFNLFCTILAPGSAFSVRIRIQETFHNAEPHHWVAYTFTGFLGPPSSP